ncbi:EOG090X091L, partial [Symbiodinium sp. KB8]
CPAPLSTHRDLQTPPGEWVTLACPFDQFYLTKRGALVATQRPINQARITGIGITAVGSGPFSFEVQYIAALYEWQPEEYAALPHAAQQARLRATAAAQHRHGAQTALPTPGTDTMPHPLSSDFTRVQPQGAPSSEEERVRRVRTMVESQEGRLFRKTRSGYFTGEQEPR